MYISVREVESSDPTARLPSEQSLMVLCSPWKKHKSRSSSLYGTNLLVLKTSFSKRRAAFEIWLRHSKMRKSCSTFLHINYITYKVALIHSAATTTRCETKSLSQDTQEFNSIWGESSEAHQDADEYPLQADKGGRNVKRANLYLKVRFRNECRQTR